MADKLSDSLEKAISSKLVGVKIGSIPPFDDYLQSLNYYDLSPSERKAVVDRYKINVNEAALLADVDPAWATEQITNIDTWTAEAEKRRKDTLGNLVAGAKALLPDSNIVQNIKNKLAIADTSMRAAADARKAGGFMERIRAATGSPFPIADVIASIASDALTPSVSAEDKIASNQALIEEQARKDKEATAAFESGANPNSAAFAAPGVAGQVAMGVGLGRVDPRLGVAVAGGFAGNAVADVSVEGALAAERRVPGSGATNPLDPTAAKLAAISQAPLPGVGVAAKAGVAQRVGTNLAVDTGQGVVSGVGGVVSERIAQKQDITAEDLKTGAIGGAVGGIAGGTGARYGGRLRDRAIARKEAAANPNEPPKPIQPETPGVEPDVIEVDAKAKKPAEAAREKEATLGNNVAELNTRLKQAEADAAAEKGDNKKAFEAHAKSLREELTVLQEQHVEADRNARVLEGDPTAIQSALADAERQLRLASLKPEGDERIDAIAAATDRVQALKEAESGVRGEAFQRLAEGTQAELFAKDDAPIVERVPAIDKLDPKIKDLITAEKGNEKLLDALDNPSPEAKQALTDFTKKMTGVETTDKAPTIAELRAVLKESLATEKERSAPTQEKIPLVTKDAGTILDSNENVLKQGPKAVREAVATLQVEAGNNKKTRNQEEWRTIANAALKPNSKAPPEVVAAARAVLDFASNPEKVKAATARLEKVRIDFEAKRGPEQMAKDRADAVKTLPADALRDAVGADNFAAVQKHLGTKTVPKTRQFIADMLAGIEKIPTKLKAVVESIKTHLSAFVAAAALGVASLTGAPADAAPLRSEVVTQKAPEAPRPSGDLVATLRSRGQKKAPSPNRTPEGGGTGPKKAKQETRDAPPAADAAPTYSLKRKINGDPQQVGFAFKRPDGKYDVWYNDKGPVDITGPATARGITNPQDWLKSKSPKVSPPVLGSTSPKRNTTLGAPQQPVEVKFVGPVLGKVKKITYKNATGQDGVMNSLFGAIAKQVPEPMQRIANTIRSGFVTARGRVEGVEKAKLEVLGTKAAKAFDVLEESGVPRKRIADYLGGLREKYLEESRPVKDEAGNVIPKATLKEAGPTGHTLAEINKMLDTTDLTAEQKKLLDTVVKEFKAYTDNTVDMWLKVGDIDAGTAKAMKDTPAYVNRQDLGDPAGGSRSPTGRRSEAILDYEAQLHQTMTQAGHGLNRLVQNERRKAFADMITAFPNNTATLETPASIAKRMGNGDVKMTHLDEGGEYIRNLIKAGKEGYGKLLPFRDDAGELHYIRFNVEAPGAEGATAREMAKSFTMNRKSMDELGLQWQTLQQLKGFTSKVFTHYNVLWAVQTNAPRDILYASAKLTKDFGAEALPEFSKTVLSVGEAHKKLVEEARAEGALLAQGLTSAAADVSQASTQTKAADKAKKNFDKFVKAALDKKDISVENALEAADKWLGYTANKLDEQVRVGVYAAAKTQFKKQGFSEADSKTLAAAYAKESTVNFEQQGYDPNVLMDVVPFLTAKWKGLDNNFRAFGNKEGLAYGAVFAVLGAMIYSQAREALGDDEAGDAKVKNMQPSTDKMIGVMMGDRFTGVQGPELLSNFMAAGKNMAALSYGDITASDFTKKIVLELLDLTPIPTNRLVLQKAAKEKDGAEAVGKIVEAFARGAGGPVGDLGISLGKGQDAAGNYLRPTNQGSGNKLPSELASANLPESFRKTVNESGLGVSPNLVAEVDSKVTGGLGKIVSGWYDFVAKTEGSAPKEWYDTKLMENLVKKPGAGPDYDPVRNAARITADIKRATDKKIGYPGELERLQNKYPELFESYRGNIGSVYDGAKIPKSAKKNTTKADALAAMIAAHKTETQEATDSKNTIRVTAKSRKEAEDIKQALNIKLRAAMKKLMGEEFVKEEL